MTTQETPSLDFNWSDESITFKSNESCCEELVPDALDRGKYAEFLTNFLRSKSGQPYVLNLNAEWGAGKTYFLKRWFCTIQDQYPCAYVDAWKNDFSDDPLLTVISEILKRLESYDSGLVPKKKKEKALKAAGRVASVVGKELFKGLVHKASGVDLSKLDLEDLQSGDIPTLSGEKNGIEKLSDITQKVFQAAIIDHEKKIDDLEIFKNTIQDWLEFISIRTSLPMFVFIDELDRCRPNYAIELLEVVKHLFEIKGLVFVIATDTDQLQHSVKAVYGDGFDATRYLSRFFDRRVTLKLTNYRNYIDNQMFVVFGMANELKESYFNQINIKNGDLENNLASIAGYFKFDLRTINQWLDQLWSSDNNKSLWMVNAFLLALKLYDQNIYYKLFYNFSDISVKDELINKYKSINNHENYVINFIVNRNIPTTTTKSVYDQRYGGYVDIDIPNKFINNKNNYTSVNMHQVFDSIFHTFSQNKSWISDFEKFNADGDNYDFIGILGYLIEVEGNRAFKKENYLSMIEMSSSLE